MDNTIATIRTALKGMEILIRVVGVCVCEGFLPGQTEMVKIKELQGNNEGSEVVFLYICKNEY